MKIYALSINEISDFPIGSIVSSGQAASRSPKRIEYYASKEKAEARQKEVYDGLEKLVGFFPSKYEAIISEIEVRE